MGYSMNMKDEKAPKRRKLLPQGWRDFTIINCRETTAKSGNPMFVFSIQDKQTGYEEDIYAINMPGKRWFLKSILEAVGCSGAEDGQYDWDISDVINQDFQGLIEHEPNEFINRDGEKVTTTQHRIVEVKAVDNSWMNDPTDGQP